MAKFIYERRKTSEKTIAPYLVRQVKGEKGLCIKLSASIMSGIPDRLVLIGGQVKFAETKTGGEKPSKLQLKVHALLRDMGFEVWVLDSREAVTKFIKSFYSCGL